MKNLESREDIELLVNSFYDKVVQDETIGFFFKDVVNVDFKKHLPKMYSFWETILFGQMSYKGNPMAVHFPINQLTKNTVDIINKDDPTIEPVDDAPPTHNNQQHTRPDTMVPFIKKQS